MLGWCYVRITYPFDWLIYNLLGIIKGSLQGLWKASRIFKFMIYFYYYSIWNPSLWGIKTSFTQLEFLIKPKGTDKHPIELTGFNPPWDRTEEVRLSFVSTVWNLRAGENILQQFWNNCGSNMGVCCKLFTPELLFTASPQLADVGVGHVDGELARANTREK